MMELNQNVILIAVAVVGLLVCYFLWREVKRTQSDVQGLKAFSANVAHYIEPAAPSATGGPTCEAGGTCDITATAVESEEVQGTPEEKKDN